MKKLSFLLCMMLALVGMSAQAASYTVTVNVDDATHVKAQSYGSTVELKTGANTFTFEDYLSIEFSGVSPWAIKSVTNTTTGEPVSVYGGTWYGNFTADATYEIKTFNIEESRSATATFNIDNASKAYLYRRDNTNSTESIQLNDGANTVKFNPETESFNLYPASSAPLYEVKVNGEVQPATGGSGYELHLADGAVVDITANYPDIDVNVTFVINEEAQDCIGSVVVDNAPVTDFNGKSLTVKAGQTLFFSVKNDYIVDSFAVNGQTTGFYGSYSQTIVADTEFALTAHLPGMIKATVIVDDPSNIRFGTGAYSVDYGAKIIDLNAGENTLELPESNALVCWAAANGSFIESVVLNEETLNSYNTSANLTDGAVLKFTTGKINKDRTAIVWIDNKEAAETYFGVSFYDRTSADFSTGYNELPFYAGMLPMGISWYSSVNTLVGKVYVNGEQVPPPYENATSYYINTLNDKDVVKVFLADEPVECSLIFNIENGIAVNATVDRITPVTDFTAPMVVFAGTEVALTVPADQPVTVSNGDTEITPDADGKYVVTVNGTTPIIVAAKGQTGIDNIMIDNAESKNVIFDIYGRRVTNPTSGNIYIINGKKTLVK